MKALTKYLSELSPSSRAIVKFVLARFVDERGNLLPLEVVKDRYEYVRKNRSLNYARNSLTSLKKLVRLAHRYGEVGDEYLREILEIRPPRGRSERKRRMLTTQEIKAMMSIPHKRLAAVVAILATTGMRRSELADMTWDNVIEDGNTFLFVIHGKGNVTREIRVPREVLAKHIAVLKRSPSEFVIGHPRTGEKRSGEWVLRAVRRAARYAGITWDVRPHDLRRAFISHLLLMGVDVFTAARAAGHSSPSVTMRYDIRPMMVRDEAVAKLAGALVGNGV